MEETESHILRVQSILERVRARAYRGHRALEGTDGCRGDRWPRWEHRGLLKKQRTIDRTEVIEETEGSRGHWVEEETYGHRENKGQ